MDKDFYRLWALRTDDDGIKEAASMRFSRVTPKYVLIYAPGAVSFDGGVEVESKDIHRLTEKDKSWLFDCAATLAMERLRDNGDAIADDLREMVDRFAAELEKESKES